MTAGACSAVLEGDRQPTVSTSPRVGEGVAVPAGAYCRGELAPVDHAAGERELLAVCDAACLSSGISLIFDPTKPLRDPCGAIQMHGLSLIDHGPFSHPRPRGPDADPAHGCNSLSIKKADPGPGTVPGPDESNRHSSVVHAVRLRNVARCCARTYG